MGTEIHWEETKWAAEREKEMGRKTRYEIWQLAPLLKDQEPPELMGVYEPSIE